MKIRGRQKFVFFAKRTKALAMRGVIAILMLVVMVMVVWFDGIFSLVGESSKKASQLFLVLVVGSG